VVLYKCKKCGTYFGSFRDILSHLENYHKVDLSIADEYIETVRESIIGVSSEKLKTMDRFFKQRGRRVLPAFAWC